MLHQMFMPSLLHSIFVGHIFKDMNQALKTLSTAIGNQGLKSSIDHCAVIAIAIAAYRNHDSTVRLLAHMGARLLRPDGEGFWIHYQDDDTHDRMRDLSLSIIRAGGNDSAPGQPVTGASLATRVALLNAAELYDPRVRVSRAREELRKDYFVLSLLLDSERATAPDGEVMARLQVLPSELVREVIEYF